MPSSKSVESRNETSYNMVIVGAPGSGKSCIVIRFIAGRFVGVYEPTLEDSYRKQIVVDDEAGVVDIFDTAGADDFVLVRDAFMRDAEGFLCIYAINDPDSFEEVTNLYDHCKRVKDSAEYPRIPCVILANKCDLKTEERKVSTEQGVELARSLGAAYFETSALTGANVTEAFCALVRDIRRARRGSFAETASTVSEDITEPVKKKMVKKDKKCIII